MFIRTMMHTRFMLGILSAILAVGSAVGADLESSPSWKERVAQLSAPGPGDIVLTAVGDAIWTHKISGSTDERLQSMFNVMRESDIAFLNFEQVLADHGFPTLKEIVKADPSIIDEFVWAGVDIVSIANNHMMDFGPSGLATTQKALDDHGIKHSGAGTDLAQALRPAIIERKGLKIGLVSIMVAADFSSLGTPAREHEPGVAPIDGTEVRLADGSPAIAPSHADLHHMEEAIRNAKKVADLVAVSFHIHWGELEHIDPDGKQLIARAAVDAGADMVLGHGPHVINGIEFYKDKPIFYSMGNFAFQPPLSAYEYFPDSLKLIKGILSNERVFEGMMLRITLSSRGEIRRLEVLPLAITQEGDPHFVAGEKGDGILKRLENLSEPFDTSIKRESWFAVVDLP